MIKRVVQMTFKIECVDQFQQFFEERKNIIKNFDGCTFLELWQDIHHTNIFFTHSIWASEHQLNQYRFSEFFKDTWKQTKTMFSEKAHAWSVQIIE